MSQETTNRYFDELASGLASGSISRRKALRLMGAALVGGVLASIPGVAQAKESLVCPEPDTFCGPSGQFCCAVKNFVRCCPAETPVCCRVKSRPACAATVEDCEAMHGKPVS